MRIRGWAKRYSAVSPMSSAGCAAVFRFFVHAATVCICVLIFEPRRERCVFCCCFPQFWSRLQMINLSLLICVWVASLLNGFSILFVSRSLRIAIIFAMSYFGLCDPAYRSINVLVGALVQWEPQNNNKVLNIRGPHFVVYGHPCWVRSVCTLCQSTIRSINDAPCIILHSSVDPCLCISLPGTKAARRLWWPFFRRLWERSSLCLHMRFGWGVGAVAVRASWCSAVKSASLGHISIQSLQI